MKSTLRMLLRVDSLANVFALADRGVVVLPPFAWGSGKLAHDAAAELRRPDGRVLPCEVMLCPERLNRAMRGLDDGPPAFDRVCFVKGLAIEAIAAGSEVWCAEWLVAEAGDPLDDRPGTRAR